MNINLLSCNITSLIIILSSGAYPKSFWQPNKPVVTAVPVYFATAAKDAASRGHSARSVASVRRTPIADFVDLFFVYRKSRGHSRAGGAAFGAFANGT